MLAVPTKTSDGLIEKSEDKMLEDILMHRFRWPKALKGVVASSPRPPTT
jgi:hypothetical protein